jgi:putative cell wall-binding protein
VRSVIVRGVAGLAAVGAAIALAVGAPATASTPAFAPAFDRIAGSDRVATSLAVAKAGFPTTAPIVFVASALNYPDALAAGPVAAHLGGPLLLTMPTALTANLSAELTHLAPTTVVIVGETRAVSKAVESQVARAVPAATVTRLGGADRWATAGKVIRYGFTASPSVYVATGDSFPDALSAAAAAGAHGEPLVLVDGSAQGLSAGTRTLLANLGVTRATIVGGTSVVTPAVQKALQGVLPVGGVTRVSGADRFATSAAIAVDAFPTATHAYIASGLDFPDALSGSALAGRAKAPLLTVPGTCIPATTLADLAKMGVTSVTEIGGAVVVSPAVATLAPCSGAKAQPSESPTRIVAPAGWHADSFSSLDAVDCVSATWCEAVGRYNGFGATTPGLGMFANLHDGRWVTSTVPLPADANASPRVAKFSDISCPSTVSCVAIGGYTNKSGQQVGLIETLAGGRWTPRTVAFPVPGTTNPWLTLDSVSCGAAGSCVVVGGFEGITTGVEVGLLLTLSGGAWTEQVIGTPPLSQPARLRSVSCTSAVWCVAVGEVPYQGIALIDTFAAGQWTMQSIPTTGLLTLSSVSCSAQASCTAVGATLGQTSPTVVETLAGGVWTASTVGPPPGAKSGQDQTQKIACATGNICASYAAYSTSLNVQHEMLTVIGNGHSSAVPAPLPPDARGGGANGIPIFSDVSCPSAGSCTVVGEYFGNMGAIGLIETLANGRWTASRFTYPSGESWVTDGHVYGVSCNVPSVCQVVGTQDFIANDTAQYSGLAEQLR